jgi:hypothetical protein
MPGDNLTRSKDIYDSSLVRPDLSASPRKEPITERKISEKWKRQIKIANQMSEMQDIWDSIKKKKEKEEK